MSSSTHTISEDKDYPTVHVFYTEDYIIVELDNESISSIHISKDQAKQLATIIERWKLP